MSKHHWYRENIMMNLFSGISVKFFVIQPYRSTTKPKSCARLMGSTITFGINNFWVCNWLHHSVLSIITWVVKNKRVYQSVSLLCWCNTEFGPYMSLVKPYVFAQWHLTNISITVAENLTPFAGCESCCDTGTYYQFDQLLTSTISTPFQNKYKLTDSNVYHPTGLTSEGHPPIPLRNATLVAEGCVRCHVNDRTIFPRYSNEIHLYTRVIW